MRILRGLGGAAAALAAGGIAVWAGHIGSAGWWRWLVVLFLGVVAWIVATFLVPLIALEAGEEVGSILLLPVAALVVATIWFTAIDIEVRTGQWQAAVVTGKECQSTDSGCAWVYRVSDRRTEQDLGWIGCNENVLALGDQTRVHSDAAGRHRPNLEPCAHTSHAWTVALWVVEGLWILMAVGALAGAIFFWDW
ncbi:hypothetical protein [Dactylosporangium sp. CS-033363]|uniref:hypothetical protein n=1 Tax=Dactylosporangium sp. CS-033363 TaxID=3239935 RepID=UPI003D929A6A